ncbi:MAG: exosortase A [Pseudomonadota bacterium]
MKHDGAALLTPSVPLTITGKLKSALPFLLLGALLVWLFGWYWGTAASIESSWSRSETFQHGYLIVPISAWLIWRRQQWLARIPPAPVFWPVVLLAILGVAWLLADLAQVVVIRQYALVLMVPVIVAIMMGVRFAWALAFPLMFLVFAVPFGDFLIPPMMNFTADFTVTALRITGIPVYREGTHFSLPSGNWSVVEACSGLRYLISTITLGCLYAYLTYRKLKYQLIFIALSVVIPVIANGLRAYMIVMIGHLSSMRLAVGVDHLIYGWVFFGIVIMLLFWVGSFWREDTDPDPIQDSTQSNVAVAPPLRKLLLTAIISAGVIAVGPTYADRLDSALKLPVMHLAVPEINGWKKVDQRISSWQPHYLMSRASIHQSFEKDGRTVGLFVGYYNNQTEGMKLISSRNALIVTEEKSWIKLDEQETTVANDNSSIKAHQSLLRGPETKLLALDWFWVKGEHTNSSYVAKLLQAKSRLLHQGDDSAVIILYTRTDDRSDAAQTTLREFAKDGLPVIERALNAVQQN